MDKKSLSSIMDEDSYRDFLYLRTGGSKCPHCHSDQIEGDGPFESDGDWVTHKIRCLSCEARWDDLYTLRGVTNFEAPTTDERNIE